MEQIKTYLNISDRLGFGFQMQHPNTSGWNRFKNKILGVPWLNVFSAMRLSIFVDYLDEGGGKRCCDGMSSGGVCTGRRNEYICSVPL